MVFWQKVHWFATPSCNEECKFCFKPDFQFEDSPKVMQTLATKLAENDVREVVITGGEPLLLRSLDSALEVLNDAGIDVSIHTNATLLTQNRLRSLVGLVDEVAVPIDSMDEPTQTYLRGTNCLPKVKRIFRQLQDQPTRIGIHSVATGLNVKHMPAVYDFLKSGRFDSWKVYEYNPDFIGDRFESVARFEEVQKLRGKIATGADGGVNCLFADFLLMEDYIAENQDGRVQFVGVKDYDRAPYFFLDSGGNVQFCTWFLQGKRRHLGNILKEGFEIVKERAIQADAQGPLFDEDAFIETEDDSPLWTKYAWEGNYFPEEVEAIDPMYHTSFIYLSELYLERLRRQGKVPEKVE